MNPTIQFVLFLFLVTVYLISLSRVQSYKMVKVYPLTKSRFCRYTNDNEKSVWRYHRETKQCYQIGTKGPCNDLMKFSLENSNDDFGICDCDLNARCGRPLIYWPHTDRCYHYGEQGPCLAGRWLVFGVNGHPTCRKNICMEEEDKSPSNQMRYWTSHRGKCFKTYTKAFCTGENDYLHYKEGDYKPTCQPLNYCHDEIQKETCYPGQKSDYYGKCRKNPDPLGDF